VSIPPTLLIVYLRPDQDAGASYHIDETLTTAGITYHLIAKPRERVSLESAAPFVVTYNEKLLVFALRAPLDPKAVDDMAQPVTTGLILGFVVKGEIALGDEVGVINNLGGLGFDNIRWGSVFDNREEAHRIFVMSLSGGGELLAFQ
jgi:hypothetical protein